MTCSPIKEALADDSKVTGIACSRGRSKSCKFCGQKGTLLCDAPVQRGGKMGTCDASMCRSCAHNVGPEKDLCPPHWRNAQAKKAAGL